MSLSCVLMLSFWALNLLTILQWSLAHDCETCATSKFFCKFIPIIAPLSQPHTTRWKVKLANWTTFSVRLNDQIYCECDLGVKEFAKIIAFDLPCELLSGFLIIRQKKIWIKIIFQFSNSREREEITSIVLSYETFSCYVRKLPWMRPADSLTSPKTAPNISTAVSSGARELIQKRSCTNTE